jgi:hypothetical protein
MKSKVSRFQLRSVTLRGPVAQDIAAAQKVRALEVVSLSRVKLTPKTEAQWLLPPVKPHKRCKELGQVLPMRRSSHATFLLMPSPNWFQ